MRDRRQNFRGRVYYGGRVAFNERKSTIDCIVRNFTPSGAKIEFANAAMLPDEIDLSIARKGVAYLARIVWRRQHEAGLAFRNPRQINEAVSLDVALRLRASERARKSLQRRVKQLCSEI
jgi:hypothetical protein